MEPITSEVVIKFLQQLGENYPGKVTFYLLGGSALCLLGSPRETLDIDYAIELDTENFNEFKEVINSVATKLKLDVESVPLAEFIPLPQESGDRRKFIGNYGNIEVYVFDLYSIALSKIARGFDSDLEDVIFMLKEKLIDFDILEEFFHEILPLVAKVDIVPSEFQQYFSEIRRRFIK